MSYLVSAHSRTVYRSRHDKRLFSTTDLPLSMLLSYGSVRISVPHYYALIIVSSLGYNESNRLVLRLHSVIESYFQGEQL